MQSSLLKDLDKRKTNWIIKIRVARKYIVLATNNEKVARSLEIILVDNEGERIQASIMPPYVSKFDGLLREQSIYYFTNFTVKDNAGRFRITNHTYRLYFMPITKVIGVGDKTFMKSIYNFKSISEIEEIVNVEDVGLFDFIGQVVAKQAIQYQKTNSNGASKHVDIVLQDLENKKIDITLWGSYADEIIEHVDRLGNEPIVMIIQLCRPKVFQGKIGLCNTYHATKLIFTQGIKEIEDFKSKMSFDMNNSAETITFLPPSNINVNDELESGNVQIMTLEQVVNCKKIGFYWVLARISAVVSNGDWYYISCQKCRKKLNDSPNGYYCEQCSLRSNNPIPRYKVKVNVVDGTLDSTFMLWDGVCEALIGKTALEMREQFIKGLDGNGSSSTKYSEYSLSRAGRPEDIEILVGRLLLFRVNVKDRNVEKNDPVFSVSRISDNSQIIDKHKKTSIDVTKTSELLSWLAKSGEEVIELDDSISDNEDDKPINCPKQKARFETTEDRANSSISDEGSSTKLSKLIDLKDIKQEKE